MQNNLYKHETTSKEKVPLSYNETDCILKYNLKNVTKSNKMFFTHSKTVTLPRLPTAMQGLFSAVAGAPLTD